MIEIGTNLTGVLVTVLMLGFFGFMVYVMWR